MIRLTSGFLALSFLLFATPSAHAQYPLGASAFHWSGSSGNTAGSFCWESSFSCTPDKVVVTANEVVDLTVRGEFGAPYVIGLSAGANQCQVFPGIMNALVLDPPAIPAVAGGLDYYGGILACPAGTSTYKFTLPATMPPGTVFVLQCITLGAGGSTTFTTAIQTMVV